MKTFEFKELVTLCLTVVACVWIIFNSLSSCGPLPASSYDAGYKEGKLQTLEAQRK